MTQTVLTLILAGGQSTRMGRDKAQLMWGGKSLMQRMVEMVKQAGFDLAISVAEHSPVSVYSASTHLSTKQFWTDNLNALCSHCPPSAMGPLAGLCTALAKIVQHQTPAYRALLILPIDLPNLDADFLQTLVQALPDERLDSLTPQVVYVEDSPLPAVLRLSPTVFTYHQQFWAQIAEESVTKCRAGKSMFSVRRFWAGLPCKTLPATPQTRHALYNVNHQEAWQILTKCHLYT